MMNTKKMIEALRVDGFMTMSAQATALIYDGFDYESVPLASGDNIAGADGGTGFTGAWANTRNTPDFILPGYTAGSLPVVGGAIQGNAWSGVARPIGSTLADANLLDDGATLWMSVIFDLTGQNTTNADLNLALTNAPKFHSSTFGDRENLEGETNEGIGITHSGGFIQAVYWQNNDGATDTVAERTESANSSLKLGGTGNPTTALIVMKIEWGVGAGDETVTLYAPDNDLNQVEVLAATAFPAIDQSLFNNLALQFKDTSRMDEIRFGATFEDVIGDTGNPALPGDTNGDGDVDDSDLGTSFANYTGPVGDVGKTAAEGDTDNDGDVDDSDLGNSFANYTGPLGGAPVPEPTSLALMGLGGLALARRRRA